MERKYNPRRKGQPVTFNAWLEQRLPALEAHVAGTPHEDTLEGMLARLRHLHSMEAHHRLMAATPRPRRRLGLRRTR